MKITSELYSLADIVRQTPSWHFNIPIYQRLYVWSDDQVLTLLNDLLNAYERDENIFFLGGALLVEQESDRMERRVFDIIDGQQRFTTLWLLSHAWRGALEPFLTVKEDSSIRPRLRFGIRPEVNHFLELLTLNAGTDLDEEIEATRRMRTSLGFMQSIFAKRPLPERETDSATSQGKLAEFVFNKVKFVITTVPKETDLNKLFEVINNRGVQLQHHEILKALILEALPENERAPYAVLWEACADMGNFIERNLASVSGMAAHEVSAIYQEKKLADAKFVLEKLNLRFENRSSANALTMQQILESEESWPHAPDSPVREEDSPSWVRSIFGFPLFLQHVLRIWLYENSREDLPRLLDRELLASFEQHFFTDNEIKTENARSFIELLWRIRVLFDGHVIKWVDQGEEEIHLISSISVSISNDKRYISRSREVDTHRAFTLLQSMLYHSQEITTQYWLTPLLLFIHKTPNKDVHAYFDYLRHLDNYLLGAEVDKSLIVRTRTFMDTPWRTTNLIYREILKEDLGVKFPHYWFYKLEFILWYLLREKKDDRWKKFRVTAKSSVEHISPQTPTSRDENRAEKALNHFGNLALVARSLNSEYGNLPFNEKRQRYINKNKERLDSLKMALIYENDQWNDENAFEHQKEMIEYLDHYYALKTGVKP